MCVYECMYVSVYICMYVCIFHVCMVYIQIYILIYCTAWQGLVKRIVDCVRSLDENGIAPRRKALSFTIDKLRALGGLNWNGSEVKWLKRIQPTGLHFSLLMQPTFISDTSRIVINIRPLSRKI